MLDLKGILGVFSIVCHHTHPGVFHQYFHVPSGANSIQRDPKKKEHLQHIYTVGTKALVLSSCMQEQHKPTLINLGYRVRELETTNSAGNAQSMAHTHKDPN